MAEILSIVSIRDSAEGITEAGPNPEKIKGYFTQHGITVHKVSPKANGDIFLMTDAPEDVVEDLWRSYHPSVVQDASLTAAALIDLAGLLVKFRENTASLTDINKGMAIITELALESYGHTVWKP